MLGVDIIDVFFLTYPHPFQLGVKFGDGHLVLDFPLRVLS